MSHPAPGSTCPPTTPSASHNLPYGVFSTDDPARAGSGCAIGDQRRPGRRRRGRARRHGVRQLFDPAEPQRLPVAGPARLGRGARLARSRCSPTPPTATPSSRTCCRWSPVTMHLPFEVADYVDFYASEQHATNVGRIFRPDGEALTPNWKHLPIGYHGRAGTVVVSAAPTSSGPAGSARRRPTPRRPSAPACGSTSRPRSASSSAARPAIGSPRRASTTADDHLFGVVLLNDWSARDIQAWEYVPLGPFLGKSFAQRSRRGSRRWRRCAAARVALPGQDPRRCPTCAATASAPFGLDLHSRCELNGQVVSPTAVSPGCTGRPRRCWPT